MTLRSEQNPEEYINVVAGPTRYREGPNQSQLVCGFCHESYFVDSTIFNRALTAMEEGLDSPFRCGDCEATHEEMCH
jgi:hypothetical protein